MGKKRQALSCLNFAAMGYNNHHWQIQLERKLEAAIGPSEILIERRNSATPDPRPYEAWVRDFIETVCARLGVTPIPHLIAG
jgi:hypothetical protein